jgi:hypothetical protein
LTAQRFEASFHCAICGEVAGRVQMLAARESWSDRSRPNSDALAEIDRLLRPDDQAALVVDTFLDLESRPVLADRVDAVVSAISAADASALYALSYSFAPFSCPQCAASYCGRHWTWRRFDDGDFSGVEGTCPHGHFHVLQH